MYPVVVSQHADDGHGAAAAEVPGDGDELGGVRPEDLRPAEDVDLHDLGAGLGVSEGEGGLAAGGAGHHHAPHLAAAHRHPALRAHARAAARLPQLARNKGSGSMY